MSQKIMLSDIFPLENLEEYKVHFSVWNGEVEPLNVFLSSPSEFKTWNEFKAKDVIWTKKYIFTLANFYHEENTWLFAGVWEVLNVTDKKHEVRLTKIGEEFSGRLKISYHLASRNRRRLIIDEKKGTNLYNEFEVKAILDEPYSGVEFEGFDNINLSFQELKIIFAKNITSWKNALQNSKGVYLITDIKTGKKYVGSAYRDNEGIWGRWKDYISTGHGNNIKLRKLLAHKGRDYIEVNFRFSLLETFSRRVEDVVIIGRESFWKDVLVSREFGYNDN